MLLRVNNQPFGYEFNILSDYELERIADTAEFGKLEHEVEDVRVIPERVVLDSLYHPIDPTEAASLSNDRMLTQAIR